MEKLRTYSFLTKVPAGRGDERGAAPLSQRGAVNGTD